jgi:hypothetical protein
MCPHNMAYVGEFTLSGVLEQYRSKILPIIQHPAVPEFLFTQKSAIFLHRRSCKNQTLGEI